MPYIVPLVRSLKFDGNTKKTKQPVQTFLSCSLKPPSLILLFLAES